MSMSNATNRMIAKVENAFQAYSAENVSHVSFSQIKDWLNNNTRDGISSNRLSYVLRRTPQFIKVDTYRRIGSNATETFWALEGSEGEIKTMKGWVKVEND